MKEKEIKGKILLVDGFSLLFRAFYALPLFNNALGEYTNAVYGFITTFLKFYDEEKPDLTAVAFDLPEPTFRHKCFEDYKSTRKATPPEFSPQIPIIMELLAAMNIPTITCPEYEADDILGTLAKQAERLDYNTVIVTGDQDLLQIASETIKIRIPKNRGVENYHAADVLKKFGVSPSEFIDVKALMGDNSDNIPGVPGIGEKTALKMIIQHGSLETAIAYAKSNPDGKKVTRNLVEFEEQARLSKQLVTIVQDAPVSIDFSKLKKPDIWNDRAEAVVKRLEFKSLLPKFVKAVQTSFIDFGEIVYDIAEMRNAEHDEHYEKALLASYILNEPITDLQVMINRMEANEQLYLYNEVELPLSKILLEMQSHGIRVDKPALIKYGEELDSEIERLTGEIYEIAGEVFNINSSAQMGVILFERLGLKGTKKTKTGYSTAADVLEKLDHPIIEKILAYRTHTKLKSTYVDGILPLIDPRDSRLHSTFKQTLTTTGRIASADPNLQNIPIRTQLGRNLRKVFQPEKGFVFIDADYSQIELRVLAHMSGDTALIQAFHNNEDIHALTASEVFAVPLSEVSDFQRNAAKAVNFGIIYGISAFGLAEDLNISRMEAQMYIDGYFRQYPKVKVFMDDIIKAARMDGYVKTLFNRRRLMPELESSNYNTRSFGERAAMNMPIQGTAADIIKIAMVQTDRALKQRNLQSRIILQVHDELLLEVLESERDEVKALLKHEMENAVKLSVPLTADIHEGYTWYDTK
ncbi:MAG: DNA polymerase I [Turicibacter sp.]|nr:DNA polymerase I [Turicibacter sp.]